MNQRATFGLGIVIAGTVAGLLAAPALPEQVTISWDATGIPSGTAPKTLVLVGGPLLASGVVGLFELIPRLNPLEEEIASFGRAYDSAAVVAATFTIYAYGAILLWNLGYDFEITQALAPAIAVLFVAVGLLLECADRNWFIGIRTPWTLSSDRVWRRTHDRTAPLFKLAGIVALGGVVLPELFVYFVAVPAVVITVFATVYSYLEYKRVDEANAIA